MVTGSWDAGRRRGLSWLQGVGMLEGGGGGSGCRGYRKLGCWEEEEEVVVVETGGWSSGRGGL